MASSLETSEAEKEYDAFMKKVKRTVYFDNISPQVTESVIRTAFEQFGGGIRSVHFISNYLDPYQNKCALVEMESAARASTIIDTVSTYPFMMSGMPRPVRARAAQPEMFDERPAQPRRRIQFYWLDPKDPDFEVAQRLKRVVQKHSLQRSFLLKNQQEEEVKLSKQQSEALKGHYQKFDTLDSVHPDLKHLGKRYEMNLAEDDGYRVFD